MSLKHPTESRLADPINNPPHPDSFRDIYAVYFDLNGNYQVYLPPHSTNHNHADNLNGKSLQITIVVPVDEVAVATFEPMNWPSLCKEYVAWFLGDLYSFGQDLFYDPPPPNPGAAVNRETTFTIQPNGTLLHVSMKQRHLYQLNQLGAQGFYVTLRAIPGSNVIFKYDLL